MITWLCTLGIDKRYISSYKLLAPYSKKHRNAGSSSSLPISPRKKDEGVRTLSELYEASGASQDDLSKGGIDGNTSIVSSYWYNGAVLSEVIEWSDVVCISMYVYHSLFHILISAMATTTIGCCKFIGIC